MVPSASFWLPLLLVVSLRGKDIRGEEVLPRRGDWRVVGVEFHSACANFVKKPRLRYARFPNEHLRSSGELHLQCNQMVARLFLPEGRMRCEGRLFKAVAPVVVVMSSRICR